MGSDILDTGFRRCDEPFINTLLNMILNRQGAKNAKFFSFKKAFLATLASWR
jgi:hypothetical protein